MILSTVVEKKFGSIFATKEALEPLANDLIMSNRLILSFERKNPSIILDFIDCRRGWQEFWSTVKGGGKNSGAQSSPIGLIRVF